MAKKTLSDKDRSYGQVIVDYGNLKATTDDLGLKFIENIQKAFNFSDRFTKKAKKSSPILSDQLKNINIDEAIKKQKNPVIQVILIQYKISTELNRNKQKQEIKTSDDVNDKIRLAMQEHVNIYFLQMILAGVLFCIVHKEKIYEITKVLESFLRQYRKFTPPELVLEKDYSISNKRPFVEKELLNLRNNITSGDYYEIPVIYCFVEFFTVPGNREYIKQCETCKKFYIANTVRNNRKFCSRKCKNDFYNMQKSSDEIKEAVKKSRLRKKRNN